MNIDTKEKIVKIADKVAIFFFVVMAFFLPISTAVIESSFGFIFMCFIVKFFLKRPPLERIKSFFKNRINLAVLVFYLCIGLSVFAGGHLTYSSFKAWITKWGEGMVLFFLAQVFLKRKHIKLIIGVFLSSVFLTCVDGIYQWVAGRDFIRGFKKVLVGNFAAITASFGHYNDYAAFLTVMFFINFGFIFQARKALLKSAEVILSLLILANLIFTYSRGGWLSFFAGILFLILVFPNKKIKLASVFFLFIFVAVALNMPSVEDRILLTFKSGGDGDRFRVWKVAFMMIKESPVFGGGLNTFMDYIKKHGGGLTAQYAHNCYLQILAETGPLGLLSFLWFLWEIIAGAYRKIVRGRDILFSGVFCGFLAFLTHSFFDTQLFTVKLASFFWLLASFITVRVAAESAGAE